LTERSRPALRAAVPEARRRARRRPLAPALALATAAAALALTAVPAGAAVSVNPGPTAKNASVWSEISFRGVRAGKAGPIVVRGSRSGRHAARRLRHSDNRGFSLVLKRPLRAGERGEALPRAAHERAPGARQVVEELGCVGARQGPQARSDAARGDDAVEPLEGCRHAPTLETAPGERPRRMRGYLDIERS